MFVYALVVTALTESAFPAMKTIQYYDTVGQCQVQKQLLEKEINPKEFKLECHVLKTKDMK